MKANTKEHWENIFTTKKYNEVSWSQEIPTTSLELIKKSTLDKKTKIIDIGGGDSKLVDYLLKDGFTNLTVLDISQTAINRAKERLGQESSKVKWIVSDILDFKPIEKYGIWHDRASFHFLTQKEEIEKYLGTVKSVVTRAAIIGTFSTEGPKKCSSLEIKQYDEITMKEIFLQAGFKNTECKREDHITPGGITQNFVFCNFSK